MNKASFLLESEVYGLLNQYSVQTPTFFTIPNLEEIPPEIENFHDKSVVLKGLAPDLWHKSDIGALSFFSYSPKIFKDEFQKIKKNVEQEHTFASALLCERLDFYNLKGLPSEGFLSIKKDSSVGHVINLGIGGLHTEFYAKELQSGIMQWPIALTTPQQALEEFENHLLGKIWLGKIRGGTALTTKEKLFTFLRSIFELGKHCQETNISLLEVNPFVLSQEGIPTALDGVGLRENEVSSPAITREASEIFHALVNPQTICLAGVSEKAGNFGMQILDNLLTSNISIENLSLIKPKMKTLKGVKCFSDVSHLHERPVDNLIVALPAPITVKVIMDLCEQGGGANIVYLVAGGLGDGADKEGLGKELLAYLHQRREKGLWTPHIIGPNSLGIVLSPSKINTIFIPPQKLDVPFHEYGNIAFISQSGAFFITRFSNEPEMPIKYGFCIGNQMDLDITTLMDSVAQDSDIDTIAIYVEGFNENQALHFAQKAKELGSLGKRIVLYKGGRSNEGMTAAAGHTGAMTNDFDLLKKTFCLNNVHVAESFSDFSKKITWTHFTHEPKKYAVISNAGFETVSSGDAIGQSDFASLYTLSETEKENLKKVLHKHKLESLVSPTVPLDLTPMAGDQAYLDSLEAIAQTKTDVIILGIVPLTERLNTYDQEKYEFFAKKVKEFSMIYKKTIIVVVDSGKIYDHYRQSFQDQGLLTYSSLEEAII